MLFRLSCMALLVCAMPLFSQIPAPVGTLPEHIGVEQGLSQGFVNCLLQDREGFVWTGTPGGLNRFDGHRFHLFSHDPYDRFSLSASHVKALCDAGEFLLVGTEGAGFCIFHKKTRRFFRLPVSEKKPGGWSLQSVAFDSLPATGVHRFLFDADNTLWIQTHVPDRDMTWLCRAVLPAHFWERLSQEPELVSSVKYEAWYFQSSVFILNGKQKLLARMDRGNVLVWRNHRWENLEIPSQLVGKIQVELPSRNLPGNFWLITQREIWFSGEDGTNWQPVTKLPPGKEIFHFDKHVAWVRSDGHFIEIYPLRQPPFSVDWSKPIRRAETTDIRWVCLFDRSDNLWHVNTVHGLLKINPNHKRFQHYLPGESIHSFPLVLPSGNAIFLKGFSNPKFLKPPLASEQALLGKLMAKHTWGVCLRNDAQGRCWMLGIQDDKTVLVWVNPLTGASKTWEFPFNYSGPTVFGLDPDDGSVCFPVEDRLVRFEPGEGSGKWTEFSFRHLLEGRQQVYGIAKTADGSWWLGTDGGLIRFWDFDPAMRQAKTAVFRNDSGNRNSLSNNSISCLLTDPDDGNILWIGTKGGGLNRLDVRSMQFSHLTKRNGLPDDVIYGILAEGRRDEGRGMNNASLSSLFPRSSSVLWFSTNRGIVRYDPQTGGIKSFRKIDGLQDDEFNTWTYAGGQNGEMYFGGINGMNVFHPKDLADNPHRPNVLITGLKINNLPVEVGDSSGILKQAIEFSSGIVLPFSQNTVTLEFAALEFTATSKNKYRYWLEGLEKENAHENNSPTVTYFHLPPGNYTFIVYGSNNDGVWSEQPAYLKIRILPPWHRHWLAYSTYVLLVAGLIFWYLRLRESKQKLAHRLELEKQKHAQRLALERQEYTLRLETERREAELLHEMNRLKLEDFTERLLEKTELLNRLQAEKEHENGNGNGNGSSRVEKEWEKLYASQLLTKPDWASFQKLFEQVYPGFLAQLAIHFPSLTPAETRLLSLMKMKLSREKTASMLGVSPDTVGKTRLRLRKKLELEEGALEKIVESTGGNRLMDD